MAANKGNRVKVDYEGRLETGEVFDSSTHGDHSHPIEFEIGKGEVIAGFDSAVLGMDIGDEKEFEINPEEAYGERDEKLIQKVPRKAIPNGEQIKKGMTIVLGSPDGKKFPVTVTDDDKESITLDLNHPLAGKKLIFKIKLVEIH